MAMDHLSRVKGKVTAHYLERKKGGIHWSIRIKVCDTQDELFRFLNEQELDPEVFISNIVIFKEYMRFAYWNVKEVE